jgi:hypothetical protein
MNEKSDINWPSACRKYRYLLVCMTTQWQGHGDKEERKEINNVSTYTLANGICGELAAHAQFCE